MVASDTIVGIVGAVVLVAVMAGVFVYEYNNPASATSSGTDNAAVAAFAKDYPGMDPYGDIDHDGISNINDTDMDGDGINNSADHDNAVVSTMSGTIGPGVAPAVVNSLDLGLDAQNGTVHIEATVTATSTQPCNLVVDLQDAQGKVVNSASITPTGGKSATVQTTMGSPVVPGAYKVHVTQSTGGLGCSVDIKGTVHYPTPAMATMDHSH